MPRLLDLFCAAGGAAMGYSRAGFEVFGVDNRPQPRYPFASVLADALEYLAEHGEEYDVIHASPPCQAYSRATCWAGCREDHPDLIGPVREILMVIGKPYIIENVQEARRLLQFPLMLCGSMFGLRIQRHRYFEVPLLPLILLPDCRHSRADFSFDHGKKQSERVYADAMGCAWMTVQQARQAVPPAYTHYIGGKLLNAIGE